MLSVITAPAVPGGTGVTVLARLRGADGQLVTQASLASVTYSVADLTSGEVLGTGTVTISSAVYDDLQQGDPRWTADGVNAVGDDGEHGFNFAATPVALTRTACQKSSGISGDCVSLVRGLPRRWPTRALDGAVKLNW